MDNILLFIINSFYKDVILYLQKLEILYFYINLKLKLE